MEWQQQKDELVLNVILSYLTVLNNEDRVQVALKQTEISQQAVDRLTVLNNQGAIKPSDLSDLKGQLMNDQLAVLTAKDQLETSKLLLAQWMNKPYDTHMKLERINVEEALTAYAGTPDDVYQSSLNQFAQVKAVELRRKSAEYSVKTARGQLYPSVSVGAGINTNYSSIAQSGGQKISYTNQLRNNRYTSVGVGVSIPIFNGSFARNRIKLADINLRNNELVEENTRLQLRQLIDQAYLSMTNAFERYKVLLDQVNAYQESFRAAEVRYQAGVGTSIDYLTAKDRLDRANVNLLNAQYDYILRKRILDYYRGSTK
jgi:outer membrane protein